MIKILSNLYKIKTYLMIYKVVKISDFDSVRGMRKFPIFAVAKLLKIEDFQCSENRVFACCASQTSKALLSNA